MTTTDVLPDLSAPGTFVPELPLRAWAAMRRSGTLHWQTREGAPGFYSVTRHDHARAVLCDGTLFSSQWGMTLDSALGRRDPGAGLMIELSDAADHARLRRIVSAALTPHRLAGLEDGVRAKVREKVWAAVRAGEVDFVSAVAAALPAATIGTVLGLPESDWDEVAELASGAICGSPSAACADLAERRRDQETANSRLLCHLMRLIEEPSSLAPDGLVRRLLEARVDSDRLTADEVVVNCLNLAIGGNETTRNASASAVALLAERPDACDRLRDDRALVRPAVEEILRHATPAMHLVRTVTAPTTLAGTDLAPGDTVCVWLASANRDESVFHDADAFVVDRYPNPHLAFSHGPHFCLGSMLARLELRVLLDEMLSAVARVTVLGPVEMRPSNFITTIDHLLVSLTGR